MKWQLFLVALAARLSLNSGRMIFPERVYIKPGDTFSLTCEIPGEEVLIDKIYTPAEDLPSGRELERQSNLIPIERFRAPGAGTATVGFTDATAETHQGYYTCVAYRKIGFPRVETATGYVIVIDLCADHDCTRQQTCVEDFVRFTHTCEGPDPTTSPPDAGNFIFPGPTEPPGFYPVCSIFPAGVIKSFNAAPAYYDLACTHVLAADFSPGGDFAQPWFVYGTFDQHDGNTAMSHMTIFAGGAAFEFQRGWLINKAGEKFEVEEGVPRTIGDCELLFTGRHIKATCPHFSVYYDGVISGHIQLGDAPVLVAPVKEYSDIGLCWDSQSGFRPNWQVKTADTCDVDPDKDSCEASPECDSYSDQAAQDSCAELNCEDQTPTPVQVCALNQADLMDTLLSKNNALDSLQTAEGCPEIACDWQNELMSRGCPQDNPPFDCA